MNNQPYDSFLLVSFGGPERREEVMPFLENVVRGKPVPRERLLDVAGHYFEFDGKSPINDQNRALMAALGSAFKTKGIALPIYWGNRNWNPFLEEALTEMQQAGKKRALAFFTSMFSCYSGCRQYRENITEAQQSLSGEAPSVEKLRMGFNHPGFIDALAGRTEEALSRLPDKFRADASILFTAHSIPLGMAKGCSYELQLQESARLVGEKLGRENWQLCYQSRSGSPHQPWLEPDIGKVLEEVKSKGSKAVVVVPLGFISDHMEVVHDLDHEAADKALEIGLEFSRAKTVGTHPKFIAMICDLVLERLGQQPERKALGTLGPWHDVCPANCCQYERGGRPNVRDQRTV